MGATYNFSKENIFEASVDSISLSEVMRKLNLSPTGAIFIKFKRYIIENNIDIASIIEKNKKIYKRKITFAPKKLLEEILIKNSSFSSHKLRLRLFKEKIKEKKCASCGNTEWLGKEIPLELHHLNGDNSDNRLENLCILCANCHSLTPTFRGKNKRVELKNKEWQEKLLNNEILVTLRLEEKKEIIVKEKKPLKKETCQMCNTDFFKKRNKKFCSLECFKKYQARNIPKLSKLLEVFQLYKSFIQVGKYFGVTDNAIRKWCIKYNVLDDIKKGNIEKLFISIAPII